MQDQQARDRSICIQLHLNEVHDALERRKGKGVHKSDSEYALELHQDELRKYNITIKDRAIVKSIQRAVDTDMAIIERFRRLELQEAADRRLALQLSRGEDGFNHHADEYEEPDQNEYYTGMPRNQYYTGIPENNIYIGEPSSSTSEFPKRISPAPSSVSSSPPDSTWISSYLTPSDGGPSSAAPRTKTQLKQCNCCFERRETHSLTCMHNFCYPCLRQLFVKATTDETLMPVRCCGEEISIDVAERVLNDAELQAHLMKRLEVTTEDKLYCPNPLCSRFIPISDVTVDVILCPACDSQICSDCGNYVHRCVLIRMSALGLEDVFEFLFCRDYCCLV